MVKTSHDSPKPQLGTTPESGKITPTAVVERAQELLAELQGKGAGVLRVIRDQIRAANEPKGSS